MKARKWLTRGQNTADPFNGLSEVWRGFNNLFFPVEGRNEREKIKAFLVSKLSGDDASALLDKHKKQIAYLLARPVMDMRGNGKDTSQNMQAFQATTDPIEKVVQLFLVIYQVRCNLEHGQKSPDRARDAGLCDSASPIVGHVVGLYALQALPRDAAASRRRP